MQFQSRYRRLLDTNVKQEWILQVPFFSSSNRWEVNEWASARAHKKQTLHSSTRYLHSYIRATFKNIEHDEDWIMLKCTSRYMVTGKKVVVCTYTWRTLIINPISSGLKFTEEHILFIMLFGSPFSFPYSFIYIVKNFMIFQCKGL